VLTTPIAPVSGPAQTIHPGTDVEAQWWHRFGSKAMDDLVTRALAANTDIAQAEAALRQSRDLAGAARGVLFPQIDAGYSYERQRLSRNLSTPLADPNPQVFSIHTAQVSVSYTLDLFGLNRANLRSAQAAARAAEAKAQAMRVMVVGNVLLGVIQNAGLEAQAEAARASIAENREVLDLLRRRQAYGAVGKADVAAQEAALAAAEGALPPIEKARGQSGCARGPDRGGAGFALPELPALDRSHCLRTCR
jgi:outer membrane protein TolC